MVSALSKLLVETLSEFVEMKYDEKGRFYIVNIFLEKDIGNC